MVHHALVRVIEFRVFRIILTNAVTYVTNLAKDVEEKSPLKVADLQGDAATAARKLQAALEHSKDARPANLSPPVVPGEKKKKTSDRKLAKEPTAT